MMSGTVSRERVKSVGYWVFQALKWVVYAFVGIIVVFMVGGTYFLSKYAVQDYWKPAHGDPTTEQKDSRVIKYDFKIGDQFYVRASSYYNIGYYTMRSIRSEGCGLGVGRFLKRIDPGYGDQEIRIQYTHQDMPASDGTFHYSEYARPVKVPDDLLNGSWHPFSRVKYECDFLDTQLLNRVNDMDPASKIVLHVVCGRKNEQIPGKLPVPEDAFTDCTPPYKN